MLTLLKAPTPQKCHACEHSFAGAVCPLCKTERPAYTALKNATARAANAPRCLYYPQSCNCGQRGTCLDAA